MSVSLTYFNQTRNKAELLVQLIQNYIYCASLRCKFLTRLVIEVLFFVEKK